MITLASGDLSLSQTYWASLIERSINLIHRSTAYLPLTPHSGSFGTYPRPIQSTLRSFQDAAEARPDQFIRYKYPAYLNASRTTVAELLNAPRNTVTFVPNATLGVNTVFRNLQYEDGDHILYFATIYKGCHTTVQYITETTSAKAVRVEYTYPVEDDWLVSAFKQKVEEVKSAGGKVKVAIFDTVVSMPGVRVPFERLLSACKELGVLSLLDAAHGIGHLDLDVAKLDPDFMITNCHKYVPPSPSPTLTQLLKDMKMAPRPPRLRAPLRAPAKPTPHPLDPPHLLGFQNPRFRA